MTREEANHWHLMCPPLVEHGSSINAMGPGDAIVERESREVVRGYACSGWRPLRRPPLNGLARD